MLTVPQAAKRVGRNPETVRRWLREGKLLSRRVGTQHRVEGTDLDRVARARDHALEALDRFGSAPITARNPSALGAEAWRLADAFGWAKTCDAEYVALASLLRCRLVTIDAALRRATADLGFVVGPREV